MESSHVLVSIYTVKIASSFASDGYSTSLLHTLTAPNFIQELNGVAFAGQFSDCDGTGLLSQTDPSATNDDSVTCSSGGRTRAQIHARCFSIAAEGCDTCRTIDSVSFGVYQVDQNSGPPIQLSINVYKDTGCLSGSPNLGAAGGPLIKSVAQNVTDSADTTVTVNFDSQVVIEPGEAIRVEVQ